jgi:L-alanine-DL-glutamate epimerase-like enolase superfamily enzyme
MHIERVEVIPFRIPLRNIVSFSTGALDAAEHVLVAVTDTDGRTGYAEAPPRPMIYGETVASIVAAYKNVLAPMCIGKRPFELARLENAASGLVRNETARGALELACFDLYARQLGVSCHQLLGGYERSARLSVLLTYGSGEELIAEAHALSERFGISAFRLKVGFDVRAEIRACQALRRSVGDSVDLSVDANHGYDEFAAREFAHACRDLGLLWFEEPVPAEHLFARSRLAANPDIPILADESAPNPGDAATQLLVGRANAICLKVLRTGILNSNRIRGLCESLGVPIVMGSQGESGIGTMIVASYAAAFPSTSRYPTESGILFHLEDDLLVEPVAPIDGRIHINNRPGWGFEIDPGKLERYCLSREQYA